ncbi:toll/interleukin-1 receptor domain-containing protein [uncultured Limimaricola sp.]|uniref:toll/interleukin-1 receptor domain-containing protein n=1 Tax=uncultured Limimaricola sp. TaxID=2211667 RepID=UPI0030FBF017
MAGVYGGSEVKNDQAYLWLTYAWKDNEDDDVNFVIQELKKAGLYVEYDRTRLVSGQRLWAQIDEALKNPDLDAWAIYVSENSLRSEPCQEELAYALNRTLRSKGSKFPIIGIFPHHISEDLIPSAISTRKYVALNSNDWVEDVVSGVKQTPLSAKEKDVNPFGYKFHSHNGKQVLEVWPRTGTWSLGFAGVLPEEKDLLGMVMQGSRSIITGTGMVHTVDIEVNGLHATGVIADISSAKPMHIFLSGIPQEIHFGGTDGSRQYHYTLERANPRQ